MNIFGIGQNTGIDQIAAIQGRRTFASETPNSSAQGDTVTISPEAMEMYRASQASSAQTPFEQTVATSSTSVSFLADEQSQDSNGSIAAKVTAWYDNFRENMGNVPEPDFSTWPPENLARREELIKERDALAPHTSNKEFTDTNRKMNGILDEIMLLDAVGHEQVLSDADIKTGLDALHSSMDKWSGDEPGTAAYDAGEGEWVAPSLQSIATNLRADEELDETLMKILDKRAASQSTEQANNSSSATSQNTLEMYQIPSWYAEMMPIYSAEIGGQRSIKVQGVAHEHSPAWETYTSSMGKHYEDALDSHNIGDSVEERYNALIADSAQSLRIKNDFYNRVATDKELQGLMSTLGVKLPA